jgi:CubicO group peptidase (beta-lactamase class C family)
MLLLQAADAQNNFNKVDDWLKTNLAESGGRAVLVLYKNGRIVYNKAENELTSRQRMIGKFIAKRQDKDANEMMENFTLTTRQPIASCSKWLSAALVMTFVDEKKLSLEDSIGKYLPVMTKNEKGGIKAAELKESMQEMKQINSMDEAIEKISSLPMEGEPGKTFHYSNTGLQIAGAVIEKITGKKFETLFAERIAKPCNMKKTDFGKKNVALPAGGAYSTPEDYMNFLVMILKNGNFNGKQILNKSSIEKMQQNYTKGATVAYSPAEAGGWGYGFGEWTMEENDKRSNAVTSPGLFGTFPWVDIEKKYAGFLFCLNLKSKGRNERYKELKKLADEAVPKL